MSRSADDPVERWFIDRGVPHLIADYRASTDIWSRAWPVLLVAYAAGGLFALDLRHWSLARNLLAGVVIVAVLVAMVLITNAVARRPLLSRPRSIGAPELAAFLVGPAVPSLIFGQWDDALYAVLEGLAVLLVIYLVTSYGLIPLAVWAVRRLRAEIGELGRIVARGLPLLLLFTMFLFINADVWQMAATLKGFGFVAALTIFFVLGALFVISRLPHLTTDLGRFETWADVDELLDGTPLADEVLPVTGHPDPPPLSRRERINLALLSLVGQGLQITVVAVLLTAFFVVFGVFAITPATTATWLGTDDFNVLLSFHVGSQRLVLSEPLLRVAGFLGAFSGMYFTVVLATDSSYQDAFRDDIAPQIRQALAVRLVARRSTASGDEPALR